MCVFFLIDMIEIELWCINKNFLVILIKLVLKINGVLFEIRVYWILSYGKIGILMGFKGNWKCGFWKIGKLMVVKILVKGRFREI